MSEAAEASKKSTEEADRLRDEQTSAAQTAASSTALAQSSGQQISTSGVSMVQTTVPKGKAAVSVLKQALDERLFADVENVQKVNKRNFVSSGKLEIDDVAAAKLYMVTTDEKVPKLVQLLKDNLSKDDKSTPADITVTEFNSGNEDYLDWVREQVSSPAGKGSAPEDATFLEELLDDGV